MCDGGGMQRRNALGMPHEELTWSVRDCGHPARSVEDAEYACPYCVDYSEALALDIEAECFEDASAPVWR